MAVKSTAIKYEPAGTRSTKGLFLICILLSLFCFSSSHLTKEKLKQLKEALEKNKEAFEKIKAYQEKRIGLSSELKNYIKLMDFMTEEMKEHKEELPEDYPSLERFVKNVKDIVEEGNVNEKEENDKFARKVEKMKNSIKKAEMLISQLEERQAEL
ncbi:chromosome-associated kinesin KIF4-like [Poeciliopsis prolifica]|uniref:chromosome-associated kinesin KIF4-like n=1 Tax=Poeciliopsis prolifica TaxID=188132 RepID=UPI00072CB690|nr:chromosome-associated kinesin KIF4-like [Poeciliopsis prolifica]